jgi:hypothetical protein
MMNLILKLRETILRHISKPSRSIRKVWRSKQVNQESTKLCLFSHWDPEDRISDYVHLSIAAWARAGYRVVLVSTAKSLATADVERAFDACDGVVLRENVGLDFASWKAGWDSFVSDFGDMSQLVLTNDSVFGPIFPLEPWLSKVSTVGMTGFLDTNERQYHLQSFCLFLSEPLLNSGAFTDFWSRIRSLTDKEAIINTYEIGLSQTLIGLGVPVQPLIDIESVKRAAFKDPDFQYRAMDESNLNPSLHMWDTLIDEFQFPFIKTELLRINRLASKRVEHWREFVPADAEELALAIESHLQRVRETVD